MQQRSELVEYFNQSPVIALVGATNHSQKFGNIIYKFLKRHRIPVIPVNSRATSVDGDKASKNLTEASNNLEIGLVVYVVPPKMTLESLEEARSLGLQKIWVQPGASDSDVEKYLEANDFHYVTNACVMVEKH